MAWIGQAAPNATDGKMLRSPSGNAVFFNGAFWVLQTPLTAVTANTETSLFVNDTVAVAGVYPTVNLGIAPTSSYPGSTRILPPGCLLGGTMFNVDLFGVGTFTANNLTLTFGLVGPYPATTYTILATTGAVTASAESAGAYLHIQAGMSVTTTGPTGSSATLGSLTAWISIMYGPTLIAINSPVTTTSSIDTTKQYSLDIHSTWSGGSNSLQLSYGDIEVIG